MNIHKCTVDELAEIMDKSTASVHRWRREFGLPRNKDKTYDLTKFFEWYKDYVIERHEHKLDWQGKKEEEEDRANVMKYEESKGYEDFVQCYGCGETYKTIPEKCCPHCNSILFEDIQQVPELVG